MKKNILSLIAFCFFFFLPVFCPVSFAFDVDGVDFTVSDLGSFPYSYSGIVVDGEYNGIFVDDWFVSSSRYSGDFVLCIDAYPARNSVFRWSLFSLSEFSSGLSTTMVNGTRLYYTGGGKTGGVTSFRSIDVVCSAPISYSSVYSSDTIYAQSLRAYDYLVNGVLDGDLRSFGVDIDLGYLDDVQYFVDSFAYHNDTANTPEWVKWGSTSTTGIDLSDSRYQVEFMMEDKSTFMRNGANDSWLTQAGVPFASAVAFAESKLEYATSYLFPSGSDQRALLQGKAAKTSLYGKASGLGSVPASAGVFKYSIATQYKAALENDSSSDKGLFYNVISDILSNQGTIAEKFFNNYQSLGKALNFTYDLYARIVDSTSGTSGNWLKIDRHNSPFEWSNNDRFLNGGVTASKGHRFINFNPETNIFKTLPDDDPVDDDDNPLPDGDPALPVPVCTGYVDNSDNSIQNIYNNYNYTYNTFYDNDLFYTDLDGNKKDTGSGMIETIGILGLLGILWTWYLALFGDLLPLWAVVLVPVFGTLFVAFLVWKFGKGLLP